MIIAALVTPQPSYYEQVEASRKMALAERNPDAHVIPQGGYSGHPRPYWLDPTDDLHASGAYRRRVAAVVLRRALASAISEAQR